MGQHSINFGEASFQRSDVMLIVRIVDFKLVKASGLMFVLVSESRETILEMRNVGVFGAKLAC